MFIGTAYSQETVTTVSATEIITKGKVIEGATYKDTQRTHPQSHHSMIVLYKKEIYFCTIGRDSIFCTRPNDLGVLGG
jgi:hypothetical protein